MSLGGGKNSVVVGVGVGVGVDGDNWWLGGSPWWVLEIGVCERHRRE